MCNASERDTGQSHQPDRAFRIRFLILLYVRHMGQHPHRDLAARRVKFQRVKIRRVGSVGGERHVGFAVDGGGAMKYSPGGADH